MEKFNSQNNNEIFDIIIKRYKEDEGYKDHEPMDGDAVDDMVKFVYKIQDWSEDNKKNFYAYANTKEGNTNPKDYNIELNENKKKVKTEKDRMKELVEMYSKKDEIFVPKKEKDSKNEGLTKEYSRLQSLASGKANSTFKENYMTSNDFGMSGKQGRTVNSIIDNIYENPAVAYQPIRQPLTADEAIELSVKRALKSGAPVKDMGFYDEVNWHLMSLGFPAKSPIDIKGSLLKMTDKD